MLHLGVLASGRGSNFQSIINAINTGYLRASIKCLITDNPDAKAIEKAESAGIPWRCMIPADYPDKDSYYHALSVELKNNKVELVLLAGFMRIAGKPLIDAFPQRIMNIHPALLPSFKGLHGQAQALEYGARIAGCTVHFVDEGVDTGPIIVQAAVPVFSLDTEDSLSARILSFEHKLYPLAVKLYAEGRLKVQGRVVHIEGENAPEAGLISSVVP